MNMEYIITKTAHFMEYTIYQEHLIVNQIVLHPMLFDTSEKVNQKQNI